MNLNDRIKQLEDQVAALSAKLTDLSTNTQDKFKNCFSVSGGTRGRSLLSAVDAQSGFGQIKGGAVIWNTSELDNPPVNQEPPNPELNEYAKGYNKHTHSRFSGGALIPEGLEFVWYDFENTPVTNMHSQAYWNPAPSILKLQNSRNEEVEAIGHLFLQFNPDTKCWETAAAEVDVLRCVFVLRGPDGNILQDSNGNDISAPLFSADIHKTSIVWDENGACWRFYAAYAPGTV